MAMTKDYDPRRDGPKTPVGNKKTPPFGPPSSRPVPRPPMPGKPNTPGARRPRPSMPGLDPKSARNNAIMDRLK